ncbi:hypothetical protein [Nocardia canadensis]|uniref:hypothetical protein n=1 Tax=Nocardia canadensis TaxID=3065238 RepID=UPI00292DC4DE|nr:hypothetical protein [Nocardia canadensis]
MSFDQPLDTAEQVAEYLRRVLNTRIEFDVRETPTVWVCQQRPHAEDLRRDAEMAERASRGITPEPGGGYAVYGIVKKNSHVFHLGQNPPDHPARLLDRSSWDDTYFGTGQIHPKPWQVRIDLVGNDGRVLTYRIQTVSRADPPREPIDHYVTVDSISRKVDYRVDRLSRFLVDAVRPITDSQYRREPWLTTATFDL